jgi:hypothetical protein
MGLHSAERDAKAYGDLFIAQAVADQLDDLRLAPTPAGRTIEGAGIHCGAR